MLQEPQSISLAQIAEQAERAEAMMSHIRSAMLAPTARKSPPIFNLSQLAGLLGAEKGSVAHRMTRGDLPTGRLNEAGSRREFTLAEVRIWVWSTAVSGCDRPVPKRSPSAWATSRGALAKPPRP